MAITVGAAEDLVVEDREVQCETKTSRVRRRQFSHGDIRGGLVGFKRLVGAVRPLVAGREFGKITVVVAHPSPVKEQKQDRSNMTRERRQSEHVRLMVEYLPTRRHIVMVFLCATDSSSQISVLSVS